MGNDLHYRIIKPHEELFDFVESFWLLHNRSDSDKEIVVLPDGRVDLIFSQSATEPLRIALLGIETHPDQTTIKAKTLMFAISFKLLATEYIFHNRISRLLNSATHLPESFWGFDAIDFRDFEHFCKKASEKIESRLPDETDNRKRRLFDLVYSSKGSLTVKELSEKSFWSSRQINRYFNQQYGISLKTYCNILRFRASLEHIAAGKLFPEQNFTDQNHFIKEIKKYSGVIPKDLSKNQNDRFILLSAIRQK
jgi:AraC-like DNA-binding protein